MDTAKHSNRVMVVIDESGWAPVGSVLSGVVTGNVEGVDDQAGRIWLISLDLAIVSSGEVVRSIGIQQRHKGREFDPRGRRKVAVNVFLLGEDGNERRQVAIAIASPQST